MLGVLDANPLYMLIIASIFVIVLSLYVYNHNAPIRNVIKFFTIIIFFKLFLIIILLLYYPIHIRAYDICFGIVLFILYLMLLGIVNLHPMKYYNDMAWIYIKDKKDDTLLGIIGNLYDIIFSMSI